VTEPRKVFCGGVAGRNASGCGVELHYERQGGEWASGRPHEQHWRPGDPHIAIRCLDCGTVMCPYCARGHFAETDEKDRAIAALKTELRALALETGRNPSYPELVAGERPS